MISTHEVLKGLPPGLWLPTAEEPTDQYLVENFNRKGHPYEDIVDYGAFVVGLMCLDKEQQRKSLMPMSSDIEGMYQQGYGMSVNGYLKSVYGGIRKLQRSLGFYPSGYCPNEAELTRRLTWLSEYAYPLEEGDDPVDFRQLLLWGSIRRLSPGLEIIYKVYGSDTTRIRKQLGVERKSFNSRSSKSAIYSFGAQVIQENGGPLSATDLDRIYPTEFVGSTYETIRWVFGSGAKFWREFDYITTSDNLRAEDLTNLGVRWALAHGGHIVDTHDINDLSKVNMFTSREHIRKNFGSITSYRETVRQAYNKFLNFADELAPSGVSSDTIALVGQKYNVDNNYQQSLSQRLSCLVKLSTDSEAGNYVRKLMREGLDLLNSKIFEMQKEDLLRSLRQLDIRSDEDLRFSLSLVPRLDVNEILASR